MKKITCLLLLIQSGFMMAQTKTVVTQYGEKVTIHPNANNGITANAGYIQLGGDLKQATKLVTTSTYTLALEGLLAGANTDAVLVIDSNKIIRYVSRAEFAGDNLGNHTATQDLNMNTFNVNGAGNVTATGTVTGANVTATAKTTTATAQITTGASIGYVATSVDAAGNVVWTDPATITTKGDNLGNHIATQDLNMNTKNIAGASNITATGKTTTATAQISIGAGDGKIAVSDSAGNVTWTDPATITTKGDNLGNHIATQDLNMNTKNIAGAANITATGKTTTATAQISTGAGDGKIAVSDSAGNVTWTDPATIATQGDNLGNHIATQDLNMNTKNIAGAANITATGKTTTATAQISTGAAVGYIATSVDTAGNVVWTDPATFAPQLAIDEFTTLAGDATFTLNEIPQGSKVQMYVNGVAISRNAFSVTGKIVTYTPASNGSYTLMANDLIKFTYLK